MMIISSLKYSFLYAGTILTIGRFSIADQHEILEAIVRSHEMIQVLNLDNLDDLTPIRIFDISGKFRRHNGTFLFDDRSAPIDYVVLKSFPLDWNSGYHRDFVLTTIENEKHGLTVNVAASSFDPDIGKSRYRIEYKITKTSEGDFKVSKVDGTHWD